jgi:outer membrane protein assembly factor BamB
VAWRWTTNGVYVADADGSVVRLDRKNGTEQWTQKGLVRRQLTAPVMYGGYLVVADAGGVHALARSGHWRFCGARAGRQVPSSNSVISSKGVTYKKRVSSPPIVADGLLLAFSDNGVLSAFSAPPVAAAASPAAPAEGAAAADPAR